MEGKNGREREGKNGEREGKNGEGEKMKGGKYEDREVKMEGGRKTWRRANTEEKIERNGKNRGRKKWMEEKRGRKKRSEEKKKQGKKGARKKRR